jgi:hypothetical protein
LRDLHLDASRDPNCWDSDTFLWTGMGNLAALRLLVRRSADLWRLAITAFHLTEEYWNWLMLSGLPFPRLESLAIHGLKSTMEDS